MKIFIDTNILLNAFLNRDDEISNKIIAYLFEKEYKIYLNGLSIINVDYILKKELQKEKRKEIIQFLIDHFHLVSNNKEIFQKAIDSNFIDFEDGVQYFSSESISADFIISDDKRGFKDSNIPVWKAKDFYKKYL
ncbi:MAG: PIN domain-containing protein [Campylobacterota bacterium]|nr:PIN domain-containing protein [Campylobacterota bacterium]